MIQGYWIVQVVAGEVKLYGPYATDKDRENEFDMCLIDPGNEYIVLLDPNPKNGYAWLPSKDYIRERLDYINNLPD